MKSWTQFHLTFLLSLKSMVISNGMKLSIQFGQFFYISYDTEPPNYLIPEHIIMS